MEKIHRFTGFVSEWIYTENISIQGDDNPVKLINCRLFYFEDSSTWKRSLVHSPVCSYLEFVWVLIDVFQYCFGLLVWLITSGIVVVVVLLLTDLLQRRTVISKWI